MTQDEIIEMAIEARLAFDSEEYPEIWQTYMNVGKQEIEAFAKLVAAKATAVEREALAQEQEPVAWMYQEYRDDDQFGWRDEILFTPPPNDPIYFRNITPVYTHPPQRTWVGLTDEEAREIQTNMVYGNHSFIKVIQAIEAKLKEKNSA